MNRNQPSGGSAIRQRYAIIRDIGLRPKEASVVVCERGNVMGDKSPKNNQKQKKQQDSKKAAPAKK
jgi:hypothetical protein